MFMHFEQDAAHAFSEIVREKNPDFNKLGTINSEPVLSLMAGESAQKHDRDGTSMRYSLFLFFWSPC